MRRLQSLAFFFFLSLFVAAGASAQKVVVVWGDSVIGGFNSQAKGQQSVPGPATVANAYRWDLPSQDFVPVTKTQNVTGNGVDPVYGFARAYLANTSGPVYFIELAIPGTDCSPQDNDLLSWHPSASGRLPQLTTEIQAALSDDQLATPTLECIFFSCGNNAPTTSLPQHINDVNAVIQSYFPSPNPVLVGTRSYVLDAPNTFLNRMLIPVWQGGVLSRRFVDLTGLPAATGGLPDGVHLTALGVYDYGYAAGIAAL